MAACGCGRRPSADQRCGKSRDDLDKIGLATGAGFHEQIAEVRHCPVGTVKTQMRSALEKLKRLLV